MESDQLLLLVMMLKMMESSNQLVMVIRGILESDELLLSSFYEHSFYDQIVFSENNDFSSLEVS